MCDLTNHMQVVYKQWAMSPLPSSHAYHPAQLALSGRVRHHLRVVTPTASELTFCSDLSKYFQGSGLTLFARLRVYCCCLQFASSPPGLAGSNPGLNSPAFRVFDFLGFPFSNHFLPYYSIFYPFSSLGPVAFLLASNLTGKCHWRFCGGFGF